MSRVLLMGQGEFDKHPKFLQRVNTEWRFVGTIEDFAATRARLWGCDRWWLVECEDAKHGRVVIAACSRSSNTHLAGLRLGRILASGGKP